MIISVASGKGGTGKTLVATSLALSLKDTYIVTLLDCDVEEPNDHILMKPIIKGREPVSLRVPGVSQDKCTHCGRCAEVCACKAIAVLGNHVLTFPQLCHGCGACSYLCPEKAITEEAREIGVIEWGLSDGVDFVHGVLAVGEAMAPPVIGCPVISSLSGANLALLVTEPTLSGIHDLERVIGVCRHFGVPAVVCINKYDVNEDNTRQIKDYCTSQSIKVAAKIPFDNVVTEALVHQVPVAGYSDGKVSREMERLWHSISETLRDQRHEGTREDSMRMASIDLDPRYSTKKIPGKCIECLAEQELDHCLFELLRGEHENISLGERFEAIVTFLKSPESKALRDESERLLSEGREVKVRIRFEMGKPIYELEVK